MSTPFVLIHSGGQKFTFPVSPEELNITRQKGYETINLLKDGEFDFPLGAKIKEFTFSSFFPAEYDSSYCSCPPEEFTNPKAAMNLLNRLMLYKKPVRLLIPGTGVNTLVSIIAHNTVHRGGEPGDIYFDVTLREWRTSKAIGPSIEEIMNLVVRRMRDDLKETPKTYTVKSGDSLSKIAKLELGSSSKWNEIYKLNVQTIGKDPNRIFPGQKLVMP